YELTSLGPQCFAVLLRNRNGRAAERRCGRHAVLLNKRNARKQKDKECENNSQWSQRHERAITHRVKKRHSPWKRVPRRSWPVALSEVNRRNHPAICAVARLHGPLTVAIRRAAHWLPRSLHRW